MVTENLNTQELFISLDRITTELEDLVSSFSEIQINAIPFNGSWTAAQVADHVTKSNIGIIKSLKKEGKLNSKDVGAGIEQLKNIFLNFDSKLQSPEFILPTQDIYQKGSVIEDLKRSVEQLKQASREINVFETIDHPIFGKIAKLELLHFVVYHSQRHIHQLKNIFSIVSVRKKTRNVIAFMHISLDGFVAGTNKEMNWITMDDEIFEDNMKLAATADTVLYGKTSYQMMEGYWPDVLHSLASTSLERQYAEWLENVDKIVFSTTLEKAEWNNTRLIKKNIPEEIIQLKQLTGGDMVILGSPGLTHSFMQWNLIDEYRVNINPVILGAGIPMYNIYNKTDLQLVATKVFKSGVIGLHYKVVH